MARSLKDIETSVRARELIEMEFGGRGRFAMLEEASGISVGQWKNFFYERQQLNEKMLNFLIKKYPDHETWLLTGERSPSKDKFPFLTSPPKSSDCTTVGSRLKWVIREYASPRGKDLFDYLEKSSKQSGVEIPADDWAQLILSDVEPTTEMITFICQRRPNFTQWVILGNDYSPQVDPTSESSVTRWKSHAEVTLLKAKVSARKSISNGNKKG